ncbi:uncharacterized protein [Typha angustifolia]|uniref:uncharacterized protein n=1 Tax=Typha angustifolia TaxID=59011 RepID=UPI003C2F0CD6
MANKLSLKLLIDHKAHKILFAEASKDVVDFLFGLLLLPVGSIVNLLTKERMVGSIGTIYKSLEQLDATYLCSSQSRTTLLSPPISETTFLLPSALPCTTKKLYGHCGGYFTEVSGTKCPACRMAMTTGLQQVNPGSVLRQREGEGYVKGVVTYTVMDDLTVVPMSTISSITLLNKFHVKDLGSLEEKVVKLGLEEGLELLKASLQSKNVLSDVFLRKKVSQGNVMV